MSTAEPRAATHLTRARGYVPGPSLRRVWPGVASAYGLKRRLTGISFINAEKRAFGHCSLLQSLTPEQIRSIQEFDGPWVLGRGASLRNGLPTE